MPTEALLSKFEPVGGLSNMWYKVKWDWFYFRTEIKVAVLLYDKHCKRAI